MQSKQEAAEFFLQHRRDVAMMAMSFNCENGRQMAENTSCILHLELPAVALLRLVDGLPEELNLEEILVAQGGGDKRVSGMRQLLEGVKDRSVYVSQFFDLALSDISDEELAAWVRQFSEGEGTLEFKREMRQRKAIEELVEQRGQSQLMARILERRGLSLDLDYLMETGALNILEPLLTVVGNEPVVDIKELETIVGREQNDLSRMCFLGELQTNEFLKTIKSPAAKDVLLDWYWNSLLLATIERRGDMEVLLSDYLNSNFTDEEFIGWCKPYFT